MRYLVEAVCGIFIGQLNGFIYLYRRVGSSCIKFLQPTNRGLRTWAVVPTHNGKLWTQERKLNENSGLIWICSAMHARGMKWERRDCACVQITPGERD